LTYLKIETDTIDITLSRKSKMQYCFSTLFQSARGFINRLNSEGGFKEGGTMDKRILGVVLLLLLALPLVCLAGEEEKKEEWKRYREITLYLGGGIADGEHGRYWHRGWRGNLSFRFGFEEVYTRRWSLALSAGYFSKAAEYELLRSWAQGDFSVSWPGVPPQATCSTISEYTTVLDIGVRFYPYRSPDGKKAIFVYCALAGFYYQRAGFKFLILDTGMEERHSGSRAFVDLFLYRSIFFNFGGGAKFKLEDNLYLETFFRSDDKFNMFTFYLGLSRRF
jgi:hypothetical protein